MKPDHSIVPIQPQYLGMMLPELEPLLESGLGSCRGKYTTEYVLSEVKTGNMTLWVCLSDGQMPAIAVTEVVDYPNDRVVNVFLGAGKGRESWLDTFESTLLAYARSVGASALEAYCRVGWRKVLDWKETQIIMRKEIV